LKGGRVPAPSMSASAFQVDGGSVNWNIDDDFMDQHFKKPASKTSSSTPPISMSMTGNTIV